MAERAYIANYARELRKLQAFAPKVQRRVIAKALRKAAKVQRDAVKRLAPTRSGALKRSIRTRVRSYRKLGSIVATTRVDRRVRGSGGEWPFKYQHLVEGGTAPHEVAARRVRGLPIPVGGGFVFRTRAVVSARPTNFMARANQIAAPQAIDTFLSNAKTGIELEARNA